MCVHLQVQVREATMQIFVIRLTGEVHVIWCNPSNTVEDVKVLVHEQEGARVCQSVSYIIIIYQYIIYQ